MSPSNDPATAQKGTEGFLSGTYRVQVRPDFPLARTAELADYLSDLGVSHLYTAPLLTAMPGSAHGYDVVDHRSVSPALGGPEGLSALSQALKAAGLGLVVDIVPNHAGVGDPSVNPTWWDVLRNGKESEFSDFYDIDWSQGKILLPVLGNSPEELDNLRLEDGELRYYDKRYPIAEGTGDGSPREVHDRQHYELVDWTRGDSELNYRRFFTITDLAGLRVEDPAVFDATHAEILRWYHEGMVQGIRVDHPDGLRDPGGYFDRLRAAAPDAWLVVEKILEPGEEMPAWPVAGTTGYDALAEVCGVFVDHTTEAFFDTLQHHLTGGETSWQDQVHEAKLAVATTSLAAELGRMARLTPEIEDASRALAELAACFPVYRTYLPFGSRHLAKARAEAGRRRPQLVGVFDRLLGRLRNPADELALRFQQYTGAVMAKGVEDASFYRWTRFTARNEVGNDPAHFGVSPDEFHECSDQRRRGWPESMTALTTHDTKRSEDVRARLAVLAEVPGDWTEVVRRWVRIAPLPDPALAHLIWQAVVGSWPISRERLQAYALEGRPRSRHRHELAAPRRGFRDRAAGPGRQDLRRSGAGPRGGRLRRVDHPARLVERARAEGRAAHHARCPRRLPGHRAVGLFPGRPGQPAAGRLRRATRAAGPHRRRAGCRRSTTPARPSCWSPAARCDCAGSGRSCSPAIARSTPTAGWASTRWPSTAAAW